MSAKKKPLNTDDIVSELSESAFFQPTSTQVGKPASRQVDKPAKPQTEKYTTHLLPETVQAIKLYAVQHKIKDYEVAQMAFDLFLSQNTSTEP
jgi:hypothetical protein